MKYNIRKKEKKSMNTVLHNGRPLRDILKDGLPPIKRTVS